MRQSPKIESPTQSEVRSLHPVLNHALANLDVQLEDELARYRRQRSGAGRTPRYSGRKSAKSLDLISVVATGGRTRPSEATGEPAPEVQSLSSSNNLEHLLSLAAQYVNGVPTVTNSPTVPIAANTTSAPESTADPSSELAIAVRTPDSAPIASAPIHEHNQGNQLSTTQASANDLLRASQQDLDDYLESSEELLRSLAAEEAEVRAERGFMQSLLTPLGLGSMLLLLLSSAMFGYLVMNPSSLGRFATLWSPNSTSQLSGAAPEAQSPQTEANIPQPNLASQEFKDLNLNTLGTLKVSPGSATALSPRPINSPSPGSSSNPAATRAASRPATVNPGALNNATPPIVTAPARPAPSAPVYPASAPPRVTAPVVEAPPRRSAPARSYSPPAATYSPPVAPRRAAPAPVAPAVEAPSEQPAPSPTAESFPYKVVTPYSNDRALEEAKTANPDSYLRQFSDGAKIQMGAYKDSSEAEARAEELRKQGISADVYKQ